MIEQIYRLRCDQCKAFGPQGPDVQQLAVVAEEMQWSWSQETDKCLCSYCRPDGYEKGFEEGRGGERGRCLMLIDAMIERVSAYNNSSARGHLLDLKQAVITAICKLPDEEY